ncbi:MAG: hypothetical protein JST69_07930 [Bacteroidetes bacterium]|nr:hypothetical protein [Bacteroidota bacterium]
MKTKYKYQLFIGFSLPALIIAMVCTKLIILYPNAIAGIAMMGIGVNILAITIIGKIIIQKSKADPPPTKS